MSQQRVLIVDDEAPMRRVLEMMLQKIGHETCAASNGQEALDLAQRESFDLILTDLRMPHIFPAFPFFAPISYEHGARSTFPDAWREEDV